MSYKLGLGFATFFWFINFRFVFTEQVVSLYDDLLIDKLLKSNYIPESLLSKTINHFNFFKA